MKIYASIPTMPSRTSVLETSLRSIAKQVDGVLLCLNDFKIAPSFFPRIENLYFTFPDYDLGSTGRFLINERDYVKDDDLIFYCDDDLVYPPDYVSKMANAWAKYGGVITVHGRKLRKNQPLQAWSRENFDKVYPCLEHQASDDIVDICGTGAMCFSPGDARIFPRDFKHLNYDDVEFSIIAKKARIPIHCIAHDSGWIQYLNPSGPTIWEQTMKLHHRPLIDLVNESKLWEEK